MGKRVCVPGQAPLSNFVIFLLRARPTRVINRIMTKPTIKVSYDANQPINWKTRALLAEAELNTVRTALNTATEHLAGIELRFRSRAALTNITREGRKLHFTFVRNGELIRVSAMGTWDDDVAQWKKELLE
jgi:hypothetical protein